MLHVVSLNVKDETEMQNEGYCKGWVIIGKVTLLIDAQDLPLYLNQPNGVSGSFTLSLI